MSGEGGFTLVELLMTTLIGLIVLAGAMTLMVGTTRRADDAQARAATVQDARVGIDAVTRDLRTQSCLRTTSPPRPPIIAGTSSSITFYLDYGTGTERRQIALAGDGALRVTRWADPSGAGTSSARLLGDDFVPTVPTFTYYAFDETDGTADAVVPTPLTAATAATVARIAVSLQARPRGATRAGRGGTPIVDDVSVRLVDPDGSPVPACA